MPDTDTKTPDTSKKPVFDGEFDADRAARLVENLRADLDKARADLKSATDALSAREDAEKTEVQKANDRAAAAEKALEKANTEAMRDRIARKHNLPDDLAEFLTGETEADIEKKAASLAKFASAKEPEDDASGDDLPGKPKTRLVPGHTSDDGSVPFDPVAVAQKIRDLQ